MSLILGVVGAASAESVVQLAGFASLVAGACSMAVGEYVSMRAQEELLTRALDDERKAMQEDPAREREVVRATLEKHGFCPATAEAATRDLAGSPEQALVSLPPWFIARRPAALASSLVLSGAAALCIGGALGYLSNRRVVRLALRQLFIVALASGVTYFVGRLFGVLAS